MLMKIAKPLDGVSVFSGMKEWNHLQWILFWKLVEMKRLMFAWVEFLLAVSVTVGHFVSDFTLLGSRCCTGMFFVWLGVFVCMCACVWVCSAGRMRTVDLPALSSAVPTPHWASPWASSFALSAVVLKQSLVCIEAHTHVHGKCSQSL